MLLTQTYSPSFTSTVEHGFYNTDQGRETFALNLKQITDAVHTTCYSDVLHSLLQCNAYYKEWNMKFGPQNGRQSDAMAQERRRWSIVSKSARGLYLLDADLKREFRREGVTPTAWIWPDRMSVYCKSFCIFLLSPLMRITLTQLFVSPKKIFQCT